MKKSQRLGSRGGHNISDPLKLARLLLSEQGVVKSTQAKVSFRGYQTQTGDLITPEGPVRSY